MENFENWIKIVLHTCTKSRTVDEEHALRTSNRAPVKNALSNHRDVSHKWKVSVLHFLTLIMTSRLFRTCSVMWMTIHAEKCEVRKPACTNYSLLWRNISNVVNGTPLWSAKSVKKHLMPAKFKDHTGRAYNGWSLVEQRSITFKVLKVNVCMTFQSLQWQLWNHKTPSRGFLKR